MYLNQDKYQRAKDAVSGARKFEAESVEARALALGLEEGLKKDALVDFIYGKLGGAKTEEAEEKKAKGKALKTGVIKEEKIGTEVEEVKRKPKGK